MRVAFTIVYNGLHHLKHMDFYKFMTKHFDYWAVVDGLSGNSGSTSWCNKMDSLPPSSTDGTNEFMTEWAKDHPNVLYYRADSPFISKDGQVNKAVQMLRNKVKQGWLWQVDADEKWTIEAIEEAEKQLFWSPMKEASFQFNHYVGKDLIAVGDWGSGWVTRLFKWRGQRFISHEPARIDPHRRILKIKDVKFDHYSYLFEEDVLFKEKYYRGYNGMYDKWLTLQSCDTFPQPLSSLMPVTAQAYNDNTQIIRINERL